MSEFRDAIMMEFWKEQERQLIRDRDILRLLKAKGKVVMPQTICHVCGSDKWTCSEDYLDGHTLMERYEDCGECLYSCKFTHGDFAETIGRWESYHSANETTEEWERRRAARHVAILIRRHELGQIHTSIKPFAKALSRNPGDFTTAKVLADWIEDHTEEFGPLSGYQGQFCQLLRQYDDCSRFLPCQYCGGAGEVYEHTSTCTECHCALAGGPYDCPGQVAPCVCRPQGTP